MAVLVDRHGRVATDLRVSLTDRCNLRCTYCMPPEGLDWLPKAELLTDDEVVRLVRIGVEHAGRHRGPLHRRRAAAAAAAWPASSAATTALTPRPEVSLTTNGIGLARLAARARGGRSRPGERLPGHPRPRPVQAARPAATGWPTSSPAWPPPAPAGLAPVKVNAVLMRGVNDDEAVPLLRFCLDHGYELRFIEQMPLDAQHGWTRDGMVTADEILERLSAEFTLVPDGATRGRRAGRDAVLVDGGPATVGVIASVTRPFCGACDRTRLTADGQIRNCLFAREESDLRGPMRAGASDEELADRWRAPIAGQAAGPRHRRPQLPAARPADVRDRRLAPSLSSPPTRWEPPSGSRAAGGWRCRRCTAPSG